MLKGQDMAQKMEFVDLKAQRRRIAKEIDAAISRVLEHGQFIMGPEVAKLETDLAAFCSARHVVTCASGTDALLIAMMAKGLGPGDGVLCPAFTYTATPESIALLGATPVFVEVDDATFNVSPDRLDAGLDAARRAGLKPVGMIAVDLFGLPADYDRINGFASANGLWVLADAAQSFGATCHGRKVGTLAEMTATSFFPAKPLGCYGDGGALMTDDDRIAEAARSIRLHGKGQSKYDVARLGLNSRIDTLQAAILVEKLKIFASEVQERQRIAEKLMARLGNRVRLPVMPRQSTCVWAQFTVRVAPEVRDALIRHLAERGIPAQVYYPRPLHHQPVYLDHPVAAGGVPVAERMPGEVLSLPMHPYLTDADIERVAGAIEEFFA